LAAERPNILWIVTEDMSPHFGCYGETSIKTPNVDRLAAEGTRFANAHVTAPICSISRSALITGMYQTSIGAQHHRSGRGTVKIELPNGVVPVPKLFKDAGYWTSNGAWPNKGKTIAKTDYNFEWDPGIYDGNDWAERKPGQPFFAQIQLHGGKVRDGANAANVFTEELGSLTKPDDLPLPPIIRALRPSWRIGLSPWTPAGSPINRSAKSRARLEGEGDSRSDGDLLYHRPRGEATRGANNTSTTRAPTFPCVVRGPGIEAGKVREDLIEHIDLAAASLTLSGISLPSTMQSHDVFAKDHQPREAVFAARDRADETVDHIRSVRTAQWLYIRNFLPQRPHLQPNNYKDHKRCYIALRQARAEGRLDAVQEALFAPTRPAEELHDTQADPGRSRTSPPTPPMPPPWLRCVPVSTNGWCAPTIKAASRSQPPNTIATWPRIWERARRGPCAARSRPTLL